MQIIQITSDFKKARVTVEMAERDAVRPWLSPAVDQGFLLLRLAEKTTKPFLPHEIVVTCSDGFRFTFEATPVQFFDKVDDGDVVWETAFQLATWSPAEHAELDRALADTSTDDRAPRPHVSATEGEVRGQSPMFRIKAMNPNERARLAMSASRAERQLLRRDKSPQVLLNLLSNPRAEAEDVLAVVKSTFANSGLLDRVAKDRRWGQNVEIRTAIARNPKTPSPTVIRLLDSLRTEDLRQMARVGALRENVRREAMRVYMKRTGQRIS
ncbi:MAG: hypothetical protein AAGE94_15005 [Acidobacteriota bacterium]